MRITHVSLISREFRTWKTDRSRGKKQKTKNKKGGRGLKKKKIPDFIVKNWEMWPEDSVYLKWMPLQNCLKQTRYIFLKRIVIHWSDCNEIKNKNLWKLNSRSDKNGIKTQRTGRRKRLNVYRRWQLLRNVPTSTCLFFFLFSYMDFVWFGWRTNWACLKEILSRHGFQCGKQTKGGREARKLRQCNVALNLSISRKLAIIGRHIETKENMPGIGPQKKKKTDVSFVPSFHWLF